MELPINTVHCFFASVYSPNVSIVFLPSVERAKAHSKTTRVIHVMVGEVGFEPTQAEADDFTDRSF